MIFGKYSSANIQQWVWPCDPLPLEMTLGPLPLMPNQCPQKHECTSDANVESVLKVNDITQYLRLIGSSLKARTKTVMFKANDILHYWVSHSQQLIRQRKNQWYIPHISDTNIAQKQLHLRNTSVSRKSFDICAVCRPIRASETHSVKTQVPHEQM